MLAEKNVVLSNGTGGNDSNERWLDGHGGECCQQIVSGDPINRITKFENGSPGSWRRVTHPFAKELQRVGHPEIF
jgi:hypothetical protein